MFFGLDIPFILNELETKKELQNYFNISEILRTMGYDEEDREDNFMDFWFVFFGPNYEDAYLYLYVSIATLEMYLLYEKQ